MAADNPTSVDGIFSALNQALVQNDVRRDAIKAVTSKLGLVTRTLAFLLQRAHSPQAFELEEKKGLLTVASAARAELDKLAPLWAELQQAIGHESPERYRQMWNYSVQSLGKFTAPSMLLVTQTQWAIVHF